MPGDRTLSTSRADEPDRASSFARRNVVIGGAIVAASLLAFGVSTAVGLAGLALGGHWLVNGWRMVRAIPALRLLNESRQELALGHLEVAEELLERDTLRDGARSLSLFIAIQRAQIAIARADLDTARLQLDQAVAAPTYWHSRFYSAQMRAVARSLRAFVNAALVDEKRARNDVRAVLDFDLAPVSALARARLAEALLLRDDPPELAEHLRTYSAMMLESLGPRERNLLRALQRWREAPKSAYRALPTSSAGMNERRAWADAVLPGAGDWIAVGEGAGGVLPPPRDSAGSGPVARGTSSMRRYYSVAFVIAMAAVWWELLNRSPTTWPPSRTMWSALAVVVAFFPVSWWVAAWRRARYRPTLVRLHQSLQLEHSPDARAELTGIAAREDGTIAATASLLLALEDERQGDLQSALQHCRAGLVSEARAGRRADANTVYALRGCRARVCAALGHEEAARAELTVIERGGAGPTLQSTERSVQLILAARCGDFALAWRIASSRDNEPTVLLHEEELGELAALEAGDSFTSDRKSRLRAEIADHPGLGKWLECVVPEATSRFLAAPG